MKADGHPAIGRQRRNRGLDPRTQLARLGFFVRVRLGDGEIVLFFQIVRPVGGASPTPPEQVQRGRGGHLVEIGAAQGFDILAALFRLPEADPDVLHHLVQIGVHQTAAHADAPHHGAEALEHVADPG